MQPGAKIQDADQLPTLFSQAIERFTLQDALLFKVARDVVIFPTHILIDIYQRWLNLILLGLFGKNLSREHFFYLSFKHQIKTWTKNTCQAGLQTASRWGYQISLVMVLIFAIALQIFFRILIEG